MGHISSGSIFLYLQWVHRFNLYCQQHELDEASQLTLDGATRFGRLYVGPRANGPVGLSSRLIARNALHAWACALRCLGVPVSEWNPRPAAVRMSPILAAYSDFRRTHRGVATGTLRNDIETAKAFIASLRSRSKPPKRVSVADIDSFVQDLATHVSKRTLAGRCSSLRCFLRFLFVSGRSSRDLAASVMAPRTRFADRPPRALPWGDVRRILRAIPKQQSPGRRDFAMLLMMALYGMGAAEVLALRLEDVDWESEIVRVRLPKTGVPVELPLLPPVARALAAYLKAERPPSTQTRCIFVSAQIPYKALTSGGIRHRIRLYARESGTTARVIGAHAFRHAHATRQIDAGANPKVVSDILGHRRPSSTSVYVRVALRRLRHVTLPVPL